MHIYITTLFTADYFVHANASIATFKPRLLHIISGRCIPQLCQKNLRPRAAPTILGQVLLRDVEDIAIHLQIFPNCLSGTILRQPPSEASELCVVDDNPVNRVFGSSSCVEIRSSVDCVGEDGRELFLGIFVREGESR